MPARARFFSKIRDLPVHGSCSEFDTLCASGWTGLKKLWDVPVDVVLALEGTCWQVGAQPCIRDFTTEQKVERRARL